MYSSNFAHRVDVAIDMEAPTALHARASAPSPLGSSTGNGVSPCSHPVEDVHSLGLALVSRVTTAGMKVIVSTYVTLKPILLHLVLSRAFAAHVQTRHIK